MSSLASATHIFFSKNIIVYAIFNDQSFNNTLTKDIISFVQLGPVHIFSAEVALLTEESDVIALIFLCVYCIYQPINSPKITHASAKIFHPLRLGLLVNRSTH